VPPTVERRRLKVDGRERGAEVSSTGDCVDSLAGRPILSPQYFLAVPRNEESNLAWSQTVVFHSPLICQGGYDFARGTVWIC